jgi:alpha-galactosidase
MNRYLPVLALLLAPSLWAADFTGHWLSSEKTSDGQTRQTSLWLKAYGDLLIGYLSRDEENEAISDGKMITGNEISFVVLRDEFGNVRRILYRGKLADGVLQLRMAHPDGWKTVTAFRRVSSENFPPMPPARAKISLPPAPDVPYNGLAKTPPMGWNSWNKFAGAVSDQIVRQIADAMASNGMKDAGYVYVNIDDTWEAGRDSEGNIQTNSKFPDMKALADYVHGKGLKLGIYSSPGPKTCARYEGSFQHEQQDAKTYAGWGIDYLKYDWCSGSSVYDYHSMPAVYAKMGQALQASGRPIVYSLCQYGVLNGPKWGASVGGNLWRTTGDISDNWKSMSHIGFDLQLDLAQYAGPGHWNDPDMLEIGNGVMTATEYRTHMSLWSLLAAPLLAGNDLRSVSPAILEILTNKEVIAIDRDALGKQARRVTKDGDLEVWARPLADGAYAAGLFNRGPAASRVTARWSDIGVTGTARVRDLWAHADRGEAAGEFSSEVPSHGVVLIKLQPASSGQH